MQDTRLPHAYPLQCVVIAPSGRRVITGDDSGYVKLWILTVEEGSPAEQSADTAVAGAHASAHASAAQEPRTTHAASTFFGHHGAVLSGAFSPNEQHAVTGGDDGVVIVWQVGIGAPLIRLEGAHAGAICSLAYVMGNGGPRVVSGDFLGDCYVWALRMESKPPAGDLLGTLDPDPAVVKRLDDRLHARPSSMRRLVSAASEAVFGPSVPERLPGDRIRDIASTPADNSLVAVACGTVARVYSIAHKFVLRKSVSGHAKEVTAVALHGRAGRSWRRDLRTAP